MDGRYPATSGGKTHISIPVPETIQKMDAVIWKAAPSSFPSAVVRVKTHGSMRLTNADLRHARRDVTGDMPDVRFPQARGNDQRNFRISIRWTSFRVAEVAESEDSGQTSTGLDDESEVFAFCIKPPRFLHHRHEFLPVFGLVEELCLVTAAGGQRSIADHFSAGWQHAARNDLITHFESDCNIVI